MSIETDIFECLRGRLADSVDCRAIPSADGRVACATPLDYPNGDGVVVWAAQRNGDFEVTDYGQAYQRAVSQGGKERRAVERLASVLCADAGVEFVEGRIGTRASLSDIGDAVWQVALAATQVAQIADYYRPRRHVREHDFLDLVHDTLRERSIDVQRKRGLLGKSGRLHHVDLYVPARQIAIEAVGGEGNWSQVASAYAKLGDLARANGYRLYSVIDDREREPEVEVVNLLVQVSRVVDWKRCAEWLGQVT